ncbi:MAG: SpoIIE family protein phosphatase [Odoribacter sp.]
MMLKKLSFSARLSLYITLITALIFIVTFVVFFAYSRSLVKQEALRNAESLVNSTNLHIDKVMQSVETAVDNLAWLVEENLCSPDSMYGITRRMLINNKIVVGSAIAFEPYFYKDKGLFFSPFSFRSDGKVKTTQLGTEDYDYHYMEWYQIPRLLKCSYWSEPYYDEGGADIVMTTYSRSLLRADGSVYAIMTADISLDWLTEMVNSIKPYENSYNFLIGRGGTYIVHPTKERILNETFFTATMNMTDTTVRALGRQMVEGKHGVEILHNDDTLSYVFYAPVKSTGWSLAIVCPHANVFSGSDRLERVVAIVGIIGLLLLLLFSIQIIKHLTKPLTSFSRSAESIAGGNFNTELPYIKTRDEMWKLYESFDFMQHSLVRYMDELKSTISNKERIESELRIASKIQMGMIPKIFPPFPEREDIDLYAILKPAKEVGGDLYDFFIDSEKLYFTIGDVSGKGIPASLFMAVTRSLFRSIAVHRQNPMQIVESMNNSVAENNESNMFVTLLVGVLDLKTGVLEYCNAGHNPPILITQTGEVNYMNVKPNIPVGIFNSFSYCGEQIVLEPNSKLFMYTDGLTEAENPAAELFSEQRLLECAVKYKDKKTMEMTTSIVEQVLSHADTAPQSDDLTILIIEYKP